MKKLEEQQAAEARRQTEINFALEFVAFAQRLRVQNGNESYFDYIARKMSEAKQSANHSENGYQAASRNEQTAQG